VSSFCGRWRGGKKPELKKEKTLTGQKLTAGSKFFVRELGRGWEEGHGKKSGIDGETETGCVR